MPSPPIGVFLTTIASQPALRQKQEYLLRILQVKKIPFTSYDLASDEDAKRLWKRKAPQDKQQLPGILVGEKFPDIYGLVSTDSPFVSKHLALMDLASEEAVESGTLDDFLRLKEEWRGDDDRPPLPQKPIGVPGAVAPLQMTPDHLKKKILARPPPDSPLKGKAKPVNKVEGAFDVSTELSGYGLQGVHVTDDELMNLVAELGLDGDDAGDLVKGLSGTASDKKEEKAEKAVKEETAKAEEKVEKKEPEKEQPKTEGGEESTPVKS